MKLPFTFVLLCIIWRAMPKHYCVPGPRQILPHMLFRVLKPLVKVLLCHFKLRELGNSLYNWLAQLTTIGKVWVIIQPLCSLLPTLYFLLCLSCLPLLVTGKTVLFPKALQKRAGSENRLSRPNGADRYAAVRERRPIIPLRFLNLP